MLAHILSWYNTRLILHAQRKLHLAAQFRDDGSEEKAFISALRINPPPPHAWQASVKSKVARMKALGRVLESKHRVAGRAAPRPPATRMRRPTRESQQNDRWPSFDPSSGVVARPHGRLMQTKGVELQRFGRANDGLRVPSVLALCSVFCRTAEGSTAICILATDSLRV